MLQMKMSIPDKAFILRTGQSCGFFFLLLFYFCQAACLHQ